jgi:hypothetical protein
LEVLASECTGSRKENSDPFSWCSRGAVRLVCGRRAGIIKGFPFYFLQCSVWFFSLRDPVTEDESGFSGFAGRALLVGVGIGSGIPDPGFFGALNLHNLTIMNGELHHSEADGGDLFLDDLKPFQVVWLKLIFNSHGDIAVNK